MSNLTPTTAIVPPANRQATEEHDLIADRLRQARFQVKLVDLCTGITSLGVAILTYLLSLALVDHWIVGLTTGTRLAALVVLLLGTAIYFVWRVLPPLFYPVNPVYAAQTIEQAAPELKNSLINLLLLAGRRHHLRPVVLEGLRHQAAGRLALVPPEILVDRAGLIRVGYGFVALLALAGLYKVLSPKDPLQTVARIVAPWKSIDRPARVKIHEVLPGDAEVYRGQVVELQARIEGLREHETATVLFSTPDGQYVNQPLPLVRHAGQDFRAELTLNGNGLQQSIEYRLQAGDAESRVYQLQVKDAPFIRVTRVEYEYPRYTQLAPRRVDDQADLAGIEGTRVRIHAEANLPIAHGYLELFAANATDSNRETPNQVVPMEVHGQQAVGRYTLLLQADRQTPQAIAYQVRFATRDGQRNAQPTRHQISVLPDLAPEIEILQPLARELELPENQSLVIEVRAFDPDYAVQSIDVIGTVGPVEKLRVALLDQAQTGQVIRKFTLVPRKHDLQAGDLLSFWAESADNRHNAAGTAEPNRSRTAETYRLRIVPATQSNSESTESNGDAAPQSGDGADSQGGDATDADQQPSGEAGQGDAEQGESGQGESGQGESGQGESGQGESGQGESGQGESGQGESGQGESGQGESEQGESGQGESGQGESGQGESGQGESGQGESVDSRTSGGPSGTAGESASADDGTAEAAGEDASSNDAQTGSAVDSQTSPGNSRSSQPSGDSQAADQPGAESDDGRSDATDGAAGATDAPHADESGPVASDGSNDGDAFERILKYMRQQGKAAPTVDKTGESADPASTERTEGQPAESADDSTGRSAEESTDAGADPRQKHPSEATGADEGRSADPGEPSQGENTRQPPAASAAPPPADGATGRDAGAAPQSPAETSAAEPAASDSSSADAGTPTPGNDPGDGQSPVQPGQGASAGTETVGAASTPPQPQTGPEGDADGGGQGSEGQPNADASTPRAASPDEVGAGQPSPSGSGGRPGQDAGVPGAENESDPVGDEAKLDYTRQATDLALDYLRHEPTQAELLERLQWTPAELQAFAQRWEQMRRKAEQQGLQGQQARRELDEQLRGLGLRPKPTRIRTHRVTKDQLQRLRQSGGDSPVPTEYFDQYRAFLKSVPDADTARPQPPPRSSP